MSENTLAAFGGSPVRKRPFPDWPRLPKEAIEAAYEVLKKGELKYSYGHEVTRLEDDLKSVCGSKHVVCVINGTLSLEIAMRCVGVTPGSTVIIPAYDHPANLNSVMNVNAAPVFADVEEERPNISPGVVTDLLGEHDPKAIIVTHMVGLASIDAFEDISERHRVPVIYDCARVIGSEWRGMPVGSFGTACSFSFEESKHLNAGEGGAVSTNSPDLAERIYACRNRGRDKKGKLAGTGILGSNYRMTEFQAACIIPQLPSLGDLIKHRTKAVEYLRGLLSDVEGIRLPDFGQQSTSIAYYNATMRYDRAAFGGLDRDTLIDYLNAEGIPFKPEWALPYDYAGKAGVSLGEAPHIPVARKVHSETLILNGNVLDADEEDFADIVRAIKKVQAAARKLK